MIEMKYLAVGIYKYFVKVTSILTIETILKPGYIPSVSLQQLTELTRDVDNNTEFKNKMTGEGNVRVM